MKGKRRVSALNSNSASLSLGSIFGRLVLLMLYCSPLFLLKCFTGYYTAAVAEEMAVQFLAEAHESGMTESSYMAFLAAIAPLGFTAELSLEGTERNLPDEELTEVLHSQMLIPRDTEFLTCTLMRQGSLGKFMGTSDGYEVLRIGGN